VRNAWTKGKTPGMTKMAVRPCLVHRCTEYAADGKSYCRQHQYRRADRGQTGARGTTAMWRRLRKQALQQARFRCQKCGRRASAKDTLVVHHADHDATNNALSNLEVLCRSCHKDRHRSRLKV
jgi:5-methylcytosine-specific restriction endonuclease McrA